MKRSEEARETLCVHSSGARLLLGVKPCKDTSASDQQQYVYDIISLW